MKTFKRFLLETETKAPLPKTMEELEEVALQFDDCLEGEVTFVDTIFGPAVNVAGNVNLKSLSLEYLPFRFNIVQGDFHCSMNKELKTLEGAPKWVKGMANFEHCWSLKNLNYLGLIGFQCEKMANFAHCKELEKVCETGKMIYTGGYIFSDCPKLESLDGIGSMFGNLNITNTAIRSFHNFHKVVKFSKSSSDWIGDLILWNGHSHQEIHDSSLNLMLVEGLKSITYSEKIAPWFKIIEDGINNGLDVMDVQDQLLDAGYTDQAKI